MRSSIILISILSLFFFACGGNENEPHFHPDAESLQIEALKVYHRKPDSALSILDKAIQMDETFYLAYNTKAMVLIEKGELNKAIAELYKSLRWNEEQAEVHLQLGMLQDLVNAPERAQDAYQNALALYDMRLSTPSEFEVQDRANRAITLIMMNDQQKGNEILDVLTAKYPDNSFIADLSKRRAMVKPEERTKEFYIESLIISEK